jgi:hypothetical protein
MDSMLRGVQRVRTKLLLYPMPQTELAHALLLWLLLPF